MRKCPYEDIIEDYLYNRLSEGKREEFEEHYFNSPFCFKKIKERNELISVIKAKGDIIFKDIKEREEKAKAKNRSLQDSKSQIPSIRTAEGSIKE